MAKERSNPMELNYYALQIISFLKIYDFFPHCASAYNYYVEKLNGELIKVPNAYKSIVKYVDDVNENLLEEINKSPRIKKKLKKS